MPLHTNLIEYNINVYVSIERGIIMPLATGCKSAFYSDSTPLQMANFYAIVLSSLLARRGGVKKWRVSFFMSRNDTDSRKRQLIAALREARGIVSVACSRSGIARRTFYTWLDTDSDFKRSVEDVSEESLDHVESKLLDCIDAGKERSIIFYLKTRGRKRGFSEQSNSENEMLSRSMMNLFANAYEGKSSRFDDPDETISRSDLE